MSTQKVSNLYRNWIFGQHAGIQQNGENPPVAITDYEGKPIAMEQLEGCASISDFDGNLRFYSDGCRVWDAEGRERISNLQGNNTSTQSILVIPKVFSLYEDAHAYWFFSTCGAQGADGANINEHSLKKLHYPSFKDEDLFQQKLPEGFYPTEKQCAYYHKSEHRYWVATLISERDASQCYGQGSFLLFNISEDGFSEPVITAIDEVVDDQGQMKFSKKGNYLAFANNEQHNIILYSFDRKTGDVSNKIIIPTPVIEDHNMLVYGLEFSQNSKYLYYTVNGSRKGEGTAAQQTGYIYQYDLTKPGSTPVQVASHLNSSPISSKGYALGQMQMNVRGDIYIALDGEQQIAAIPFPNGNTPFKGESDFVDFAHLTFPTPPEGMYKDAAGCLMGLPNNIANFH